MGFYYLHAAGAIGRIDCTCGAPYPDVWDLLAFLTDTMYFLTPDDRPPRQEWYFEDARQKRLSDLLELLIRSLRYLNKAESVYYEVDEKIALLEEARQLEVPFA